MHSNTVDFFLLRVLIDVLIGFGSVADNQNQNLHSTKPFRAMWTSQVDFSFSFSFVWKLYMKMASSTVFTVFEYSKPKGLHFSHFLFEL